MVYEVYLSNNLFTGSGSVVLAYPNTIKPELGMLL